MVRLRPAPDDHETIIGFTFNPTVVRLRLDWQRVPIELRRLSIPLWCDCDYLRICPARLRYPFNPTVVRLRLDDMARRKSERSAFNPTVVRLRRSILYHFVREPTVFQSHCGAIATVWKVHRKGNLR